MQSSQVFIPVCHRSTSVLFDPGSTYSYVTSYFSSGFDLLCDCMPISICVCTPVGESLVVDRVYWSCLVSLAGYDTWVHVIILEMVNLESLLIMIDIHFKFYRGYVRKDSS